MIQKYCTLDENQVITAFYSSDVNKEIPDNAIKITYELWADYFKNIDKKYKLIDNKLVEQIIIKSLDEVKLYKFNDLKLLRTNKESTPIFFKTSKIVVSDSMMINLNLFISQCSIDPSYSIEWKCDNDWISLNKDLAVELLTQSFKYKQDCFNTEKFHIDRINQLNTNTEVINYDITTEWDF